MANSIVTPKTYLTHSLGCRVNQAEMDSISLQLTSYGLQQTKENPDIVLLNTCAVTAKAERETRKEIRKLRRQYPASFLIVLGCAVTAREKFKTLLPEADLMLANEEKDRVIKLIEERFGAEVKEKPVVSISKYTSSGRKFIKIQEGCDLFCSFCLTAYLRGEPKSVPSAKIIQEINFWVEKGVKEIILTGINIALYGQDLKGKITLSDLLDKILKETKAERISLSSIYPEMLTDEFLNLVVNNPPISRCFHLSLQSGSESVLKRMNREIDLKKIKEKLINLKKEIPEFTFRADLIAGFPGETEEEFNETLNFIKDSKISFVHVFPFSERQGTYAFEMIRTKKWQDLSAATKKDRISRINELVKKIRNDEAKKMIDSLSRCLIVRKSRNKNSWDGLTENGWPILVQSTKCKVKSLKGKILPVKITGFENDQLLGEIVSLPTNS